MLAVCVAVVVIALPGLLTGLALGLRGWTLAGLAPLLSYAIGGLTGPWAAAMGLPFNTLTYAIATVLFAGVAFGVRRLTVRRWPHEPAPKLWDLRGHIAIGACLVIAAVAGIYAMVRGLGTIDALPQGFDAVYHGNAVRYLADTGDGSLFGTGTVNWYGDAAPVFYPNAYHLLTALTYNISGASIPAALDANTLLLPLLLPLTLIALVREFRGRAVLAGAVALTAVAPVFGLYESMTGGQLLPFALGNALTPLAAVALNRYLNRVALDTGLLLVLTAVGLLCVHSSTLFGGILFAGPLLIQRWLRNWRQIGRDLLALLPIAVVSVLAAWLQLFGALGLAASNVPYGGWPSEYRSYESIGALLSFQHKLEAYPQLWLTVALFLGILFLGRAGQLRWIGVSAALTGAFYVVVSSDDSRLVMAVSRPWWDDPWRLMSLASLALSVLAAIGLAETQGWIRDHVEWIRTRFAARAALAAVVLLGFVVMSKGLYAKPNGDIVHTGYHQPDPETQRVTPYEQTAIEELGKLVKPGEWVMNDRSDGSAWTYALTGIRTVAAHFDPMLPPTNAQYLALHFREYETDPKVREIVRKMNIHWLILGKPEVGAKYSIGLRGLDAGAPFLQEVFRNQDSVIYQLNR